MLNSPLSSVVSSPVRPVRSDGPTPQAVAEPHQDRWTPSGGRPEPVRYTGGETQPEDTDLDAPVTLDPIDTSQLSGCQRGACSLLSQVTVATLRRFILAAELPCCDHVSKETVEGFEPFAASKGLDLSPDGVARFQAAHGLASDGVVNKPTADLMVAELLNPSAFPATDRKINAAGLELVKSFESYWKPLNDGTDRVTAYLDAVRVPTIGWGHTAGVKLGQIATREQATDFLNADLSQSEAAVASLVKVPISDNQFSALTSFAFNVGSDALKNSTLLKLLNKKNYSGAADQLLKWDHAGGKKLAGLTRRRKAERKLFLTK